MRILLAGEGPTDLGKTSDRIGPIQNEGVVPILVRRILATGVPIEFFGARFIHIRSNAKRTARIGPSERGYANKLRMLCGLSAGRNADAIIAVADRDGNEHKDRLDELEAGRKHVEQAGKQCAVGVAIEMIEAWLLADENALNQKLGGSTISRPPAPESLTAKDENSPNNPKGLLRSLAEASNHSHASTVECFAAIARVVDLDTLAQRCPEGFAPFQKQVAAIARNNSSDAAS